MKTKQVEGGLLIDTGPSARGWHRQELFRRCPFLYAATYLLKLGVDLARRPLIQGSMVHVGLAHHYALTSGLAPPGLLPPADAVSVYAREVRAESRSSAAVVDEVLPKVLKALGGYQAAKQFENAQVLAIEEEVEAQFGATESTRLTQRIDLIVREVDGKVWFWDHKAVGRASEATVQRYTLCGQFLELEYHGRRLFGPEFGGVRVNLIGVSDPPVFLRAAPPPAPFAVESFPKTVGAFEALIEVLLASGLDPWYWPKAFSEQVCCTPYGHCDAWELCRWGKAAGFAIKGRE